MNLEVAIMIDGKTVKPSDELQNTLNSVVSNYVKNKFFSWEKKEVEEKSKVKRAYTRRPMMTDEELTQLLDRAAQLQHLVMNRAIKTLQKEFNRSEGGIYGKLKPLVDSGSLKFQPKVYNNV